MVIIPRKETIPIAVDEIDQLASGWVKEELDELHNAHSQAEVLDAYLDMLGVILIRLLLAPKDARREAIQAYFTSQQKRGRSTDMPWDNVIRELSAHDVTFELHGRMITILRSYLTRVRQWLK
jgi:hypothetical protein